MARIVNINKDIVKELHKHNINVNEAQLYLLGVYFGLDTSYLRDKTIIKTNMLGIMERQYTEKLYTNKVIWKIPLFEEEKEEAFSWIPEWMDKFGDINKTRRGTKSSVMSRMKKFFAEHPEVRVQDVFQATDAYLNTVTDPQYLKSSHKFIYEGSGFNLNSMLLQYVELIKENNKRDGRVSKVRS